MAKYCYLIWQDGYLTCTVNHRDYKNCVRYHPEDEAEEDYEEN